MKITEAPYMLNSTLVPAPLSEHSGEGFWYWTHLDTLQQSELHFNASPKPSSLQPLTVEPPLLLKPLIAKPVEPQAAIAKSVSSPEPEASLPLRPIELPEHFTFARTPVHAKQAPEPMFIKDGLKTSDFPKTTPPGQATPVTLPAQPAFHSPAGMHVFTEGKTAEIALKSPLSKAKARHHLAVRLRKALRAIGFTTRHLLINGEPL